MESDAVLDLRPDLDLSLVFGAHELQVIADVRKQVGEMYFLRIDFQPRVARVIEDIDDEAIELFYAAFEERHILFDERIHFAHFTKANDSQHRGQRGPEVVRDAVYEPVEFLVRFSQLFVRLQQGIALGLLFLEAAHFIGLLNLYFGLLLHLPCPQSTDKKYDGSQESMDDKGLEGHVIELGKIDLVIAEVLEIAKGGVMDDDQCGEGNLQFPVLKGDENRAADKGDEMHFE